MAKRKHRNSWSSKRRGRSREPRQRFLIVCEGEQTEPNYFNELRVRGRIPGKVKGIGESPIRVVEYAIKLSKKGSYDQVWCVFDRDVFPEKNFNAALRLAGQHHINVAYSNEAFELWYVLHFNYHQAASKRGSYAKMLTKLLKAPYEKNLPDMHKRLETRQETAIRNAEKLLSKYDPPNPARDNPSTTVHWLVKELNRFAV